MKLVQSARRQRCRACAVPAEGRYARERSGLSESRKVSEATLSSLPAEQNRSVGSIQLDGSLAGPG